MRNTKAPNAKPPSTKESVGSKAQNGNGCQRGSPDFSENENHVLARIAL